MSTSRLTGTLFFMAFGYALLSVCLFRVLSFTLQSTAFFMLYVAAAMPLGAYLAHRRSVSLMTSLRHALWALLALTFLLPIIGWLATRGQSMTSALNPYVDPGLDLWFFWQQLGYQLLVVSPFFIGWGYAEFVGYQAAIRSESRRLRRSFYLIFVWALACALVVGFWAIPRLGWLRTAAMAPMAVALAHWFLVRSEAHWRTRLVPILGGLLLWVSVGPLERSFVHRLFVATPYNVGDVLESKRLPWREASVGKVALVETVWGKFTHLSLVTHERPDKLLVLGAYDGVLYWHVDTQRENGYGPLNAAVFDTVPEGADIAILGAGGGRQVSDALMRNPNSVVAVDLIPEIFTLFEDEYSWANGHVYKSPLVETVAADGRQYLQNSAKKFDLIMLPHTESAVSIMKSLFEVGQRLHSVEAFELIRSRLKPNGLLVTMKAVDIDGRLFNTYAASLLEAGFHVVGWLQPSEGFQTFLLLAASNRQTLLRDAQTHQFLEDRGYRFVDFADTPPTGVPIYDESPWVLGVLGTMIPPETLRNMLLGVIGIGIVGLLGVTVLSLRHREPGEKIPSRLVFVLAGVGVGVHAVYLQNGVIFWLLVNLLNPLASFFVGTSLFLLAWGLSSAMLQRWRLILVIGGLGILGMLFSSSWQGYGSLVSMGAVALGSGLCFPLLGLSFQSRLLNLFIADAVGGFVGGVLGIWLPVVLGFARYFDLLPWISLGTLTLVAIATVIRSRQTESAVASSAAVESVPPPKESLGF